MKNRDPEVVETKIAVVHVRNLNYKKAKEGLDLVGKVFLPVNRKTAYYAKRRLEQLTGEEVRSFRMYLQDRGQYGYTFVKVGRKKR